MERRQVLRVVLGASLVTGSAAWLKSILAPAALDADEMTLLRQLSDTFLPDDDLPAASRLGIPEELAVVAGNDRALRRLLRLGLSWLSKTSLDQFSRSFAQLSEAERDLLLTKASLGTQKSVERVFFDRARLEIFSLYYAHPQTWHRLPAALPPQPLGYMDYVLPPVIRQP